MPTCFQTQLPFSRGCTEKNRAFCELPHFLPGFQHSVNLNVKEDVKKGKNKSKSATTLLTAKCEGNYPLAKIREAGLNGSQPAVQRKAGATRGEGGRSLGEQRFHTGTRRSPKHTLCTRPGLRLCTGLRSYSHGYKWRLGTWRAANYTF